MTTREDHWNTIYRTKPADRVSWYQPDVSASLDLVRACGLAPDAPLLDVGAGASLLVDGLLGAGFSDVTLLDLAREALAVTRARLGDEPRVREVVADVTAWSPPRHYALWHDRAVFHFLTDPAQRRAYVAQATRALRPGGHLLIATFAPDGPERCSGLPVCRYDAGTLAAEFAPRFVPQAEAREQHPTPFGTTQWFQYLLLRADPP